MMSSLASAAHNANLALAVPPVPGPNTLSGASAASAATLWGAKGANQAQSVEKVLEVSQFTGKLPLMSRNLKIFPKNAGKFQLQDTLHADLSRNKLSELPVECTEFFSMEKLILYHNVIKSIPESIVCLQSMHYLDLSRNQLSYLPPSICQLPNLQVLILNNNRLVSLPEEIGKLGSLMELDASCNEITHLPVQIGDMASLRVLNLRRNHLQEIPVEISFLQLNDLDLSANRITVLPVELRFMTSVVRLNLGENPLSCPPANLCSRGKIHVFKYLEIQAIKEDRKRGVLSEVDYKRSYRKNNASTSSQLSDLKSFNGFNGDARRKRHTADSGYGSEQPLDRRWSQDLSQEVKDKHTEDARRIVLRAANCSKPPFPKTSPDNVPNIPPPPILPSKSSPPESTSSSASSTSSGYGSTPAPPQSETPVFATPSQDIQLSPGRKARLTGLENEFHKIMDGMFAPGSPDKLAKPSSSLHEIANNGTDHSTLGIRPESISPRGESPDDNEKEARRRAAQKVLGKQGMTSSSSLPRNHKGSPRQLPKTPNSLKKPDLLRAQVARKPLYSPPPTRKILPNRHNPSPSKKSGQDSSQVPRTSLLPSPRHNQPLPVPAHVSQSKPLPTPTPPTSSSSVGSHLPVPSSSPQKHQTYRQFKEHLRQQRQSESTYQRLQNQINGHQRFSSTTTSNGHHQTSGKMTSKTTTVIQEQQFQQIDVKTMQKEAVLSYVKSKQHSSSTTSVSSASGVPATKSGSNFSNSSRSSSTSSIPQPTQSGLHHGNHFNGRGTFNSRRDAEKSATAETHINQLRASIESRLRITLPEDLATSLQDGVVLCHIANHVKPRAVPSIHVPSPAVPKLNPAKSRRNVENFLLACRKIGVREDLIFDLEQFFPDMDEMSVLVTLNSLVDVHFSGNMTGCDPQSDLEDLPEEPNYPDLVPREIKEARTNPSFVSTIDQQGQKGSRFRYISPEIESALLLTIFLATIFLLRFLEPEPYEWLQRF